MDIFDALNDTGSTIIMITHEQEIAERAKRINYIATVSCRTAEGTVRALHKKKSVKAIVISGISLLLVAAIVVGVLWYLGHRSEPVKVAPVSMFMGWLSNESTQSGNVTADNLQKIYASDTQTVTALLVQEGQTVKKGDPLFRYDTTLSDIQVERQEIAVKKDDLNLNKAKKDLANINRLRPYVPTQPTDPPRSRRSGADGRADPAA